LIVRSQTPAPTPSPEQIAFVEEAMAKFGRQTYNYSYRLTGNEADARDLTQEAFIRVFRAWKSIWDERETLNLDAFQANQAKTKHDDAEKYAVTRYEDPRTLLSND